MREKETCTCEKLVSILNALVCLNICVSNELVVLAVLPLPPLSHKPPRR